MPAVSPIERLASVLASRPFRERARLARFAGVGPSAIARAASGMPVRADVYLKLCAAAGINSMNGDTIAPRRVGDLNWKMLGLGIELRRRLHGVGSQRQMVKKIGGRVSLSTITRIETGKHVSVGNLLAVCAFIGIPPEQYCAEAEKLHVERTNETSGAAA